MNSTILMIEPNKELSQQLKQVLPEYQWVEIPEGSSTSQSLPPLQSDKIDAVLVFARIKQEDYAYKLCEALKKMPDTKNLPLLVVINRFQMMLGNDVKKFPRSSYIIAPIETEELKNKLDTLADNPL
ncbi:MAG: hypothetical protein JW860_06675 [Sedimentisphaerales bacterium]|nr:hypothetical protein [Sedimentisphaerales bacterium]